MDISSLGNETARCGGMTSWSNENGSAYYGRLQLGSCQLGGTFDVPVNTLCHYLENLNPVSKMNIGMK